MHTSNGASGPFPKSRRLIIEDDQTYAPPPMSAYSIAVFSGSNVAQPGGDSTSIGKKFDWKPKENDALKDSLQKKLSVHFNTVNSGSIAPLLLSPESKSHMGRSRSSSTTSSHGINGITGNTANSHISSGATGPTSYISNDTHGSAANTSSHGHSGLGHRTPTNIEGRRSSEVQHLEVATPSTSFDGVPPSTKNASDLFNGLGNVSWSAEMSRSHQIQPPTLSKKEVASVSTPGKHDLNSAVPYQSFGSSPAKLESRMPKSPFAGTLPRNRIDFSRPGSGGVSVKKPRVMKRFSSLGPPKRASEISQPFLPAQENHSKIPSQEIPASINSESSSQHVQSGTKTEDHLNKGRLSPDSDFFKSLKRLKESNSWVSNGNPVKNSSGTMSSPGSNVEEVETRIKSDRNVQSASQNEVRQAARASRFPAETRQPLQDVSSRNFNLPRNPSEFKKLRLPKPPNPQSRAVPQDPTPQVISKPTNQASHFRPASSRPASSRSVDEDRRRYIIHVNSREYEKLEILGRGGSSKVYKVRSLADKKTYALKKVSFDQFDESCVQGFKGEIDLLIRLKNEVRVVSLIDHASGSGSLYLLMECGDVDLAHVLQNKLSTDAALDVNFIRFHASEVFHCIQAVHNAGIVHSDLKPANFLFVGGVLKIIDFGIANAVPEHTVNVYRNSQIGTPNYMAPEALIEVNHTASIQSRNQPTTWRVGRPSDIWSCGCIIYQMIYGRPPYAAYSGQQRIMAIMNSSVQVQYPATGMGGRTVPVSAIELMRKCLARNPSHRWTVEECLDSDFLRPKAVNETFVRNLLHNAVALGHRTPNLDSIDDGVYNKLVSTILGQIRDLNFA